MKKVILVSLLVIMMSIFLVWVIDSVMVVLVVLVVVVMMQVQKEVVDVLQVVVQGVNVMCDIQFVCLVLFYGQLDSVKKLIDDVVVLLVVDDVSWVKFVKIDVKVKMIVDCYVIINVFIVLFEDYVVMLEKESVI